MRILQICKKYPYPLKDGESIAVANISKSLSTLGCTFSLLTMNTSKHFYQGEIPAFFDHYEAVYTVAVDNKVSYLGMLKNLFSPTSYHVSRLYSAAFQKKLIEILKKEVFDIIQIETVFPAIYIDTIRKYSRAKIVIRSHNVEHLIWDRIADASTFVKKWYLKDCVRKLQRFEQGIFTKVDAMLAITEADLRKMRKAGFLKPAFSIPVGLHAARYQQSVVQKNPATSIAFIGALDWMPNLDGLNWFLKESWPLIHAQMPQLRFHIAGSNLLKDVALFNQPGVIYEGEVPDAKAFMAKHDVLIVPLFSGSGIRIKILEAMALGKTVISTGIGYEGIEVTPNQHLIEANTGASFVRAICQLYQQPELLKEYGKSAQKLIRESYDEMTIARKLLHFYQYLLLSQDKKTVVKFLDTPISKLG